MFVRCTREEFPTDQLELAEWKDMRKADKIGWEQPMAKYVDLYTEWPCGHFGNLPRRINQ